PNDRYGAAVEHDSTAHNRVIAAEAPAPEAVAQHHDARSRWRIVRSAGDPAEFRPLSNHLEEVARYDDRTQPFRRTVAGQVHRPRRKRSEAEALRMCGRIVAPILRCVAARLARRRDVFEDNQL